MNAEVVFPDDEKMRSLKTVTLAVYILFALAYFTGGVTAIAGIIINYLKLEEVQGTWLESHFRWQMRTFWFGLLWAVIGGMTVFILIGFAILFANFCWIIYRIVRGWLDLNDNKPVIF